MRYELTDNEWTAINPMLPKKPRGVPRLNDRRVLNGSLRSSVLIRLAANYLAFIQLASMRLWLRANESMLIPQSGQAQRRGLLAYGLKVEDVTAQGRGEVLRRRGLPQRIAPHRICRR